MTPADLDLAVALRQVFRHPLVRAEVAALVAEVGPSVPTTEGYIGTREAARRLGVKPDTVLAWIGRGVLPAVRPPGGKSWRIRPGDLESVLHATHMDRAPVPIVDLETQREERARRLAEGVLGKGKGRGG